MTVIHHLRGRPDPDLAKDLQEFESGFTYPLGNNRTFRISHGSDYTRFFRAIGDARCFVAERGGRIAGVISVARSDLRTPDGEVVEAAYLSDLKVAMPGDGRTLLRLLRESVKWARRSPSTPGFSVVMDGTARTPNSYTGRVGIPQFAELAKLMVLRIPCGGFGETGKVREAKVADVHQCFQSLTSNQIATSGGSPEIRSLIKPTGIVLPDGAACGILEDTRRCKQLFRDDGVEMVSAHLSYFGYRSEKDAVTLLQAAANRCRELSIPAMFVSIPMAKCDALLGQLPCEDIVQAPATVFGCGLPQGLDWSMNTSEI